MTRFILAASQAAVVSGTLALGSASQSTSSAAPPPELTQFAYLRRSGAQEWRDSQ